MILRAAVRSAKNQRVTSFQEKADELENPITVRAESTAVRTAQRLIRQQSVRTRRWMRRMY